MGVMALVGLVFHVRGVNRDPTRLLFRGVVNRIKGPLLGKTLLRQHHRDGGG
ncbi:MAG: hypothetical protein A4E62_03200 [Syntrophorhabdus sp. PtaU1.Bin002]|nr:MAG: hypothetical protein A4E62_03200 [Syntrophorhabdus sp. PtaU1.Bin002]